MTRLRYNNETGTLGVALTYNGTTITFNNPPDFATITGSDYIVLALDAGTPSYEIVYLTAYTASTTTGTITRQAEDSAHWPAVAHNATTGTWSCVYTTTDFTAENVGGVVTPGSTAFPAGLDSVGSNANAAIVAIETFLGVEGANVDLAGAASTAQSNAESFATTSVATERTRAEAAEAGLLPVFNVVTYGADPTGTADSTSDIQTAVTAAAGVGMVYFPAGTYKISAPIVIPSYSRLEGVTGNNFGTLGSPITQGTSCIVAASTFTGTYCFEVLGGATPTQYVEIRHLQFQCGTAAGAAYAGGIGLLDATGSTAQSNCMIEYCEVYAFLGYGIYQGVYRRQDYIRRCDVIGTYPTTNNSTRAISLHGTDCVVDFCSAANAEQYGVEMNCSLSVVQNCAIFSNGVGVLMGNDALQNVLMNCGIDTNTNQGIYVNNTSGESAGNIISNQIHGNNTGGSSSVSHIQVQGATGLGIIGNTFGQLTSSTNPVKWCIEVNTGCLNVIMAGNVQDNPGGTHPTTTNGLCNVVQGQDSTPNLADLYLAPAGKWETTPRRTITSLTTFTMVSGDLELIALYLPGGLNITDLDFVCSSPGTTTATHWWYGLYDSNLNQLAVTADQLTATLAANGTNQLAIAEVNSTPLNPTGGTGVAATNFITPYFGLYYIGIAMVFTGTAPALFGGQYISTIGASAPIEAGVSDTGITGGPPAFPHAAAAITAGTGNAPYARVLAA